MGASCCKTLPHGEAWAVYQINGEVNVVEGPTQVCSCACLGRDFHQLELAIANESEYLLMHYRDGRSELKKGPCAEIIHPVDHKSVTVQQAVQIGDQELIVVYRAAEPAEGQPVGKAKRELIRGPGLYIPQSVSEWIHEFVWTGPVSGADNINEPARKKVNALKFQKLRTIPGKMYYDVENVRTKDNALITVKLLMFYQLTNVEKMLDNTNDPMGDFVNAVSADIIEWCAPQKFDEFLEATDKLNTLGPYAQLKTSAMKVGYEVSRIVFRGYTAPQALQRMHDNAIEKRTSLMLGKETEEEEQNMADFKLKKEAERAMQQQQLEMDKLNHELEMRNKKAQAERDLKQKEQGLEIERLQQVQRLDKKGELAAYLIAKDCQLPPTVNVATMLAGTGTGSSSHLPSFPGLRF